MNQLRIFIKSNQPSIIASLYPGIENPHPNGACLVKLESFCIPKTYVNIHESIFVFIDSIAVVHQLSLPAGIYDATTFEAELKLLLDAADGGGVTYVISVSSPKQNFIVTASGPFNYSLQFPDPTAQIIGSGLAQLSANPINGILTFPFPFDPEWERTCHFFLRTNIPVRYAATFNNILDSLTLKGSDPLTFMLPKSDQYLGQFYIDKLTGSTLPAQLELRLLDDNLTDVDTQGHYWSVGISITFI